MLASLTGVVPATLVCWVSWPRGRAGSTAEPWNGVEELSRPGAEREVDCVSESAAGTLSSCEDVSLAVVVLWTADNSVGASSASSNDSVLVSMRGLLSADGKVGSSRSTPSESTAI